MGWNEVEFGRQSDLGSDSGYSCYYVVLTDRPGEHYVGHCGAFLILFICDISSGGTEAWDGQWDTRLPESRGAGHFQTLAFVFMNPHLLTNSTFSL